MLIAICLITFVLYLIYFSYWKRPEAYPPGERGWPLIGFLPSPKVDFNEYINKFRKKYGKTFFVRMGSRDFVFVSDYKAIKSAFSGPNVAERPLAISLDVYSEFGKYGISNGNGLAWHNIRRYTIRHLRELGMGRTILEDAIRVEVENVLEDFKKYTNIKTTVPLSLNVAVINVLWKITADCRFDLNDEYILHFEKLLTDIFNDAQSPGVFFFDFFHHLNAWVPHFIKKKLGLAPVYHRARELREFLKNVIKEHKDSLDVENSRDFIDDFLIELHHNKEGKGTEITKTFSETELVYTLSDIFAPGSETVSSTIRWVLLMMAEFPEIQKKVQDEIDSVVSQDALPSLSDKNKLSYTDASFNEVMRFKTIVPYSLYHMTKEDTTIESFKIPKGTIVLACAEYSQMDPDYWKNPEKFDPERFLLPNGSVDTNKDGFMAFSVGKRVCPGESISRMEVFLFCSALLQKYSFKKVDKAEAGFDGVDSPMFKLPTHTRVQIEERTMKH